MFHLKNHSVYSYTRSISYPEDIAEISQKFGNNSFCITDFNSLTECIKAAKIAKKMKMKFIQGLDLPLLPDEEFSEIEKQKRLKWLNKELTLKRTGEEEAKKWNAEIDELKAKECVPYFSVLLIAMTKEGLNNLISIYNNCKEDENGDFNYTQEDVLSKHKDMICILGIGSKAEYLFKLNRDEEAKEEIQKYYDAFGDRLYIALELCSNKKMIDYANKIGLKLVAINESNYPKIEQRMDFRLFRNIMTADPITSFIDYQHMLTDDEFKKYLPEELKEYADQAIAETYKIDERCDAVDFPRAHPLKDKSKELRELCEEGWRKLRKGTSREKESWDRMEYELSVINDKNFSEYFIKVLAIVKTARDLGIMVGPARGSGGGSEINYLIGITKVDPLYYELYFERFLNPGRPGYPDIDLDFASVPTKSDALIDYEMDYAGQTSRDLIMKELIRRGYFNFAGYIQNEVRATTLVLFKNLAKYMGLPFDEATKITAEFSDKLAEKEYDGKWFKEACDSLGFEWEDNWDQLEKRLDFCYRYNKIPYNKSSAASGVIMIDGDDIVVPVRDGVVMYNGSDLEGYGYIKYDMLTVSTLDFIQHFLGIDYDWNPANMIQTPIGNFYYHDIIELKNGEKITAKELYDRVQNGEEIEV